MIIDKSQIIESLIGNLVMLEHNYFSYSKFIQIKLIRFISLICFGSVMIVSNAEVMYADESEIPSERLVTWNPGIKGEIPKAKLVLKLTANKLKANASKVIQAAIDKIETPGTILLPSGKFNLKSALILKSGVILKGARLQKTYLNFNLDKTKTINAITISGQENDHVLFISETLKAGSLKIKMKKTTGLKKNDLILIYCENNPKRMYTKSKWNVSWARHAQGQLVKLINISGNSIEIDTPLRLTFNVSFKPKIKVIKPIESVGIEDLHIKRLDKNEGSIIAFKWALNCWVRNITSAYCMRAHVWIHTSRFISISGSFFHHAYDYGGGGHGYGIVAGKHTTDSLFENNIFKSLRHSMMVKQGANGNVFSYNYSIENKLCDVSIHGHYSYMNLFEGNKVQLITYADYWGPTGPLTTCFRNKVSTSIIIRDHSHKANIILNTLDQGTIQTEKSCENIFYYRNRVKGKIQGKLSKNAKPVPASLYLSGPPDFWGKRPWPGIGTDVKNIMLPSESRYRKKK
ncbi:MAG: hypothetical protein COA79_11885 [Planctomycetota bacterium]|nr:MAG: hypothetical protein COA79_11885 [Planctomycetota bacterium]